jgi:hypothetical protein
MISDQRSAILQNRVTRAAKSAILENDGTVTIY